MRIKLQSAAKHYCACLIRSKKRSTAFFYVEYHGMLYVSGMFVHVSSLSHSLCLSLADAVLSGRYLYHPLSFSNGCGAVVRGIRGRL